MKIRLFSYFLFSSVLLNAVPHAYMLHWSPGSYGNYPKAGHQKKPLPIWVNCNFDETPSQEFADKYYQFLIKSFYPSRQVKDLKANHTGSFNITIPHSISREFFQKVLDSANLHFDPEYKTLEQREAIAEAKRLEELKFELKKAEEDRKKLEEKLKEKQEEERLKREAEKKAEAERRALALKAEAERRAFALKEAEEARKAFEEKKRQEEAEQEKREVDEPADCDIYTIIQLPPNFRSGFLNDQGQIAGQVVDASNQIYQAAVWDRQNGLKILPLAGKSRALSINEKGDVAIEYKQMPFETKQVVLWNIDTNKILWGPHGTPQALNNNKKVLVWSDGQANIWNSIDNLINETGHNGYTNNMYLDDNDQCYGVAVDVNKRGIILSSSMFGISLIENGKKTVVTFPEGFDSHMRLNVNDEVAAIVYERNLLTRGKDRVAIWRKNAPISYSKPFKNIKELKNMSSLQVVGFNRLGQILISDIKGSSFLLFPKHK